MTFYIGMLAGFIISLLIAISWVFVSIILDRINDLEDSTYHLSQQVYELTKLLNDK